jgi:geranylgeranyl pyrophosphate synthase
MFEPGQLEKLAPRLRGGPSLAEMNGKGVAGLDPIAGTEAISYDFLSKGGKHSRPFITLAVYDALTGSHGTSGNGSEWVANLPAAVKRVAMSIETFHKASLVHDDIEDDDQFRYGEPTVHRKYGVPTAINVGDYLIGLGYRLVSREIKSLGAEIVADVLDRLADAHLKLAEGQGAELLWRDSLHKQLSPADALKIYSLKTAPAFEAALFSGLRMAGHTEKYAEPAAAFARYLGIAFQILNDLSDWRGDNHNKLIAAGDIVGGRPTVLWALALEGLNDDDLAKLQRLANSQTADNKIDTNTIAEIRKLYESAGVFEKACELVEKYRQRAEAVADKIEPEALQRLFYYLIDTVLEKAAA